MAAVPPERPVAQAKPRSFSDIAGKWRGALNEGTEHALHCELEVARLDSGEYVGRLNSIDQGTMLHAAPISLTGDLFRFELKQVGGVFEGRLNARKDRADGIWSQTGELPQPLVLRRASDGSPSSKPGVAAAPGSRPPLTMPLAIHNQEPPQVLHGHGKSYLVYELELVNFGASEATLLALEVLAEGKTIARFEGAALEELLERPRDDRLVNAEIQGGALALAFLWVPLGAEAKIPSAISHRATAKVRGFTVSAESPHLHVVNDEVVIDPPLRGGPWVAGNGPDNAAGHRRALIPVDGVESLAQRFAIDFRRLDESGRSEKGNGAKNEDHAAYGQEAVAVADARVASVTDGIPENIPGQRAVPITMETIAGNTVVLELGNGLYACYAHLQPGSLRVKAGDRVKRGQVLALVGNSGNSTAPHLHFHVTRGKAILGSEGVPFVIREYRLLASTPGVAIDPKQGHTVKRESPLQEDVVQFP